MTRRALHSATMRSLPVRGAWVEMTEYMGEDGKIQSLPVRGAWVEMKNAKGEIVEMGVAPRAGSVG